MGGADLSPDRRRRRMKPILVILLLLAIDAAIPPRFEPTALVLRGAIKLYQVTLSPVLGKSGLAVCRFEPSCSRYAAESLRLYGTWWGGAKAVWRVMRCNPWGGTGFDPP